MRLPGNGKKKYGGMGTEHKECLKMQVAELRNQALVAATAAKAEGFTCTHDALLEIVRELSSGEVNSNLDATYHVNRSRNMVAEN